MTFPNIESDLIVLEKVSELSLLDEDGWIKEDHPEISEAIQELCEFDETDFPDILEVIRKMKERSGYDGQTSPQWLQKELCASFLDWESNPITSLRKYRQRFLFKAFL